jgi:hypothetical protein
VSLETGAILRLTMQSEPGWIVEPNLTPVRPVRVTGMMVEYGPVRIGGKTYICPQRSVVTARGRGVQPLNFWGPGVDGLLTVSDDDGRHRFQRLPQVRLGIALGLAGREAAEISTTG